MPALLKTPSVLAHTIYQALSFDASLIEEGFQLQGTSAAALDDEDVKWEGISNVVLGNQDWFQAWLAGEQRCKLLAKGVLFHTNEPQSSRINITTSLEPRMHGQSRMMQKEVLKQLHLNRRILHEGSRHSLNK